MRKLWGVLFGVVLALEFALFPYGYVQGWWLRKDVSTTGGDIDLMFYGILAITGIFFVLVEAILVYIMIAYDAKPGRKVPYLHGVLSLELAWTFVPGVILLIIALWQINVWAEVKYPSRLAKRMSDENIKNDQVHILEVTARQWEWRVRYPNAERMEDWKTNPKRAERFAAEPHEDDVRTVNEVHTWKNANVFVQLKTQDVLHSFFLPNLRVKQDAVPGKTIPVWFVATEANAEPVREGDTVVRWADGRRFDAGANRWIADADYNWELACAEFCGTRHSMMRGKLYVHDTRADYLEWLRTMQNQNQQRQLEP